MIHIVVTSLKVTSRRMTNGHCVGTFWAERTLFPSLSVMSITTPHPHYLVCLSLSLSLYLLTLCIAQANEPWRGPAQSCPVFWLDNCFTEECRVGSLLTVVSEERVASIFRAEEITWAKKRRFIISPHGGTSQNTWNPTNYQLAWR
jgi:hypothetical protein